MACLLSTGLVPQYLKLPTFFVGTLKNMALLNKNRFKLFLLYYFKVLQCKNYPKLTMPNSNTMNYSLFYFDALMFSNTFTRLLSQWHNDDVSYCYIIPFKRAAFAFCRHQETTF